MYVIVQYRDHSHPAITKKFKKDVESSIIGVCGPFIDMAQAQEHVKWLSQTWQGERYLIMPVVSALHHMKAVAGAK